MKRTAEGKPAVKRVRLRVFNIFNDGHTTRILHAGPGKAYTEQGVDDILERVAADLERRFPQDEFSFVQVGPASFNFVWRGKRANG